MNKTSPIEKYHAGLDLCFIICNSFNIYSLSPSLCPTLFISPSLYLSLSLHRQLPYNLLFSELFLENVHQLNFRDRYCYFDLTLVKFIHIENLIIMLNSRIHNSLLKFWICFLGHRVFKFMKRLKSNFLTALFLLLLRNLVR